MRLVAPKPDHRIDDGIQKQGAQKDQPHFASVEAHHLVIEKQQ
jgi:hypothetical protein